MFDFEVLKVILGSFGAFALNKLYLKRLCVQGEMDLSINSRED